MELEYDILYEYQAGIIFSAMVLPGKYFVLQSTTEQLTVPTCTGIRTMVPGMHDAVC